MAAANSDGGIPTPGSQGAGLDRQDDPVMRWTHRSQGQDLDLRLCAGDVPYNLDAVLPCQHQIDKQHIRLRRFELSSYLMRLCATPAISTSASPSMEESRACPPTGSASTISTQIGLELTVLSFYSPLTGTPPQRRNPRCSKYVG